MVNIRDYVPPQALIRRREEAVRRRWFRKLPDKLVPSEEDAPPNRWQDGGVGLECQDDTDHTCSGSAGKIPEARKGSTK